MLMRRLLAIRIGSALVVLAGLAAGRLLAETAAAPNPVAPQTRLKTPGEIRLLLATRICKFVGDDYPPNVTLGQVLTKLGELHDLEFDVDERAFTEAAGAEDYNVLSQPLADKKPFLPNYGLITLRVLLERILARITFQNDDQATYLVRGNMILITTGSRAAKTTAEERTLGQPVAQFVGKDFSPDVVLGDVLDRLQSDYGVSFIIDEPAFRKVSKDEEFNLLKRPLAKQSPLPTLYFVDVAAVLEAALNRIVLPENERVMYAFRRNHILITTAAEAAKMKK